MKQEIQNRINQINNGIVPEDYKETDFGIFPIDWETDKKLGDIGEFARGKGLPGNKMLDRGIECIGYGDIYTKYNYYFDKALNHVDQETANQSCKIYKGTLLFTASGETADEIGKCVCYTGENPIYAGGDIITFVTNKVNPLFLAYQQYQKFSLMRKAQLGQGHSVVHIYENSLSILPVAYPNNASEQDKIAEVLMACDKAVELQKQYIKKLELRKKAVMQKLLTPQPDWKLKRIKDFANIKSGYPFKSDKYVAYGKYKVLTIKNVQSGKLNLDNVSIIDSLPKDIQEHQKLNIGDITISLTGNVGRVCYVTEKECLLNQRVGKLIVKNEVKSFLYYVLQEDKFISKMQGLAQGGAQGNLSNNDILEYEIYLPYKDDNINDKVINEIVDILSALDKQIDLENQKLQLLGKRQKSLQQLLLTGIVRV